MKLETYTPRRHFIRITSNGMDEKFCNKSLSLDTFLGDDFGCKIQIRCASNVTATYTSCIIIPVIVEAVGEKALMSLCRPLEGNEMAFLL